MIVLQFTVEHFKTTSTEATACLCCAYTDEYMQKPAAREGTVIGKKKKTEQNQEPNSHIFAFFS